MTSTDIDFPAATPPDTPTPENWLVKGGTLQARKVCFPPDLLTLTTAGDPLAAK